MAFSRRTKMVAIAGAAMAAIGGGSFAASAFASAPAPTLAVRHQAAAPVSAASPRNPAPKVISQMVGHGRVDGLSWSVTFDYHPTLPEGYPSQTFTGVSGKFKTPALPKHTSLLCQRMVIGGVDADGGGRPSASGDCFGINGSHDTSLGESGLWGTHAKGTAGSRLFVAHTAPSVASATVTLTSGQVLSAHAIAVPGTGYHGLAIAIPANRTIASVDMYDAHHHRIDHDTNWS